MTVSSTEHLARLDALLISRPAGRNIIDYAIEEITQLRSERNRVRLMMARLLDLAEYWINREDRRGMSEQSYRTWMSLGFQSNAYRDSFKYLHEDRQV